MFTFKRLTRRLVRDERGAAALEFALIAPMFFAAVLGTFEVGRALYERNRLSAACSLGVREMVLKGDADEAAIEAAIRSRYSVAERTRLVVTLDDESIDGIAFKKIEARFTHSPLVRIEPLLSSYVLESTRFAPIIS